MVSKCEVFYIASKWQNKVRVAELAAALERMGHAISHKWFEVEAEYMHHAPKHSREDFDGVAGCTVFVMWPQVDHVNTYVEFGIALARDKPVCIIGDYDSACIFTRMQGADIRRFANPAAFLTWAAGREA